MEIFGIGTDIIEIDRIKKAAEKGRFLEKIFTEAEREYFRKRNMKAESIAGTFAAKEAVSKSVGTGIREFSFCDIEILRDENGRPFVNPKKGLKDFCEKMNICEIKVSISHSREYAVANAMALTRE
ncbi:holo-ACP synthase [Peptacetobacter hominis]|uniref:Holo-[acyl-carrier-protein] synthase n=1 Tax=Peptacetobacter hominis TaxID=2743610 RepID=A0A544QTG1_9FIRM|nr:holo-ACP synthase [Peptacetobacter hominis]TQQ83978.1 holo-ACP synthase [Peptacetobacter hominis]